MRNKNDFEKLVFEKAEVLSAKEHRYISYRKAIISTAAVLCVLTGAAVGSFRTFIVSDSAKLDKLYHSNEMFGNNFIAAENSLSAACNNENDYSYDNEKQNAKNDYSYDNMYANAASESSVNYYEENSPGLYDESKTEDAERDGKSADFFDELSVSVRYYSADGLMKNITDKEEINDIIYKLRNAEQVRARSENVGEYISYFEIIKEDTEKSLMYKKVYTIYSDWVFVGECTTVRDTDNIQETDYDYSYSFGMSQEFLEIMRKYFI